MINQSGQAPEPRTDAGTAAPGLGADAFRTLYDAHATDCYRVAWLLVQDARLAEEVVQNVFIAIWNGAARYDAARGASKGWLLTVTHHKAVDAIRRNHRHVGPPLTDALLGHLAANDDVEAQAISSTHGTHIRAALAQLSDVQRQVIILGYFGGCSQSEIAELTGTALGTVKTRTLHALKNLRANLDLVALAAAEGWHTRAQPA